MRFYSFSAKFSHRSRFDRAARDICQSRAPFSGCAAFPFRLFFSFPVRILFHAIFAAVNRRQIRIRKNPCLCASQAQPYSVEANSRRQSPARRNTPATFLYGKHPPLLYNLRTNPYLPCPPNVWEISRLSHSPGAFSTKNNAHELLHAHCSFISLSNSSHVPQRASSRRAAPRAPPPVSPERTRARAASPRQCPPASAGRRPYRPSSPRPTPSFR